MRHQTVEHKFFGLEINADGVRPDLCRAAYIQGMKAPQYVAQLQEFLGIATYMSPFIPNLSQQTATLRDLVKNDAKFIWTDSHNAAFEATKSLICREVTLAYFYPQAESVIQVGALEGNLLGMVWGHEHQNNRNYNVINPHKIVLFVKF